MKLLVQADDYGISPAVALGIIQGIEHGIIRNTGLFANMPWTEQCVRWIGPVRDRIAFGLDANLTTGRPLIDPALIPTLVRPDGSFHSSGESRALDAERGCEHAAPDEVERELRAQIERFVELVGKVPDYLHAHAYCTPQICSVERALAREYGIPYASDVWERLVGEDVMGYRIPWYRKPAMLEHQAASSLRDYLLEHADELAVRDAVVLAGHMGYVDHELMELSSYTLYRPNDLAGVTDPAVLSWVEKADIKLITYRDLD